MPSLTCRHPTCSGDGCRREKKEPKKRVPLKRKPAYKAAPTPKDKDKEMEEFWDNCAAIISRNPYCIECGSYIPRNLYRFASAHIFPKSLFPSIANHPLNWLKLNCLCGCHDKTHTIETFSKMVVWKIAVEKFKKFEHLITENHKYLDLFRQYVSKSSN